MKITTIQQTQHPEIRAKVTTGSQEVVCDNFEKWYKDCKKVVCDNFEKWYKDCKKFKRECNFHHSFSTFSTFKNYFKQGLTPLQAVKKYFL